MATALDKQDRTADAVLDASVKRYAHLDMVRVLAVGFVAVDHGNGDYSLHNVLFTQSWVLQLLWVVSGMSWSLYGRSNPRYFVRLLAVFAIGVSVNWAAWLMLGKDWQHDIQGVVFQFFFIVGLIFYAACTLHLKPALLRMKESEISEAEEETAMRRFFAVLSLLLFAELFMAGILAVVKTSFVADLINAVLGASASFWTEGLHDREFCGQMISTFGTVVLVTLGARWLRSPRLSPWLTWIVIGHVYLQRTVVLPLLFHQFGGGVARFFVGLELFIIGLTASLAGLKGAALLREILRKYWLLALLINAFLWSPAWATRMDAHPPEQLPVILRVQLCELLWVVCFLCAGQDWFPASAWPDRLRGWLGDAALCLFLLHKAVHMLVPEPFNWCLLFVALPLPFWWRAQGPRCRRSHNDPGASKAHETSQV